MTAGLATFDEMDTTCCYARQDKIWVRDPDGTPWEVFATLADTEEHGTEDSPERRRPPKRTRAAAGKPGAPARRGAQRTFVAREARPRPARGGGGVSGVRAGVRRLRGDRHECRVRRSLGRGRRCADVRPDHHGHGLRDRTPVGAHINPASHAGLHGHAPLPRGGTRSRTSGHSSPVQPSALRSPLAVWTDQPADLGATVPSVGAGSALVYEVVLTAFLMFVIMAVATDTRAVGAAAAIAIGGTVGLDALFGGAVTGAKHESGTLVRPRAHGR